MPADNPRMSDDGARKSVIEKSGREWSMRLSTRGSLVKSPAGVWAITVVPKEDLEEAERELDQREAEIAAASPVPEVAFAAARSSVRVDDPPTAKTHDYKLYEKPPAVAEPCHPGCVDCQEEAERADRHYWRKRALNAEAAALAAAATSDEGLCGETGLCAMPL